MENLIFIRIVKDQAHRQGTLLIMIFIQTKKRKTKTLNEYINKISFQLSARVKDMLLTKSKAEKQLTGNHRKLSILKNN